MVQFTGQGKVQKDKACLLSRCAMIAKSTFLRTQYFHEWCMTTAQVFADFKAVN